MVPLMRAFRSNRVALLAVLDLVTDGPAVFGQFPGENIRWGLGIADDGRILPIRLGVFRNERFLAISTPIPGSRVVG